MSSFSTVGMDSWKNFEIRLGRRKSDVRIIMDWSAKRGIVKCNLAYVKGVYLEEVPSRLVPKTTVRDGARAPQVFYEELKPGVVLVKKEWGNVLYFMRERIHWTDDDYFESAELLIQQREMADLKFKDKDGNAP